VSKLKKNKRKIGLIIGSIGIGIVITFVIPVCGWIIGAGIALIGAGWWLIKRCD